MITGDIKLTIRIKLSHILASLNERKSFQQLTKEGSN